MPGVTANAAAGPRSGLMASEKMSGLFPVWQLVAGTHGIGESEPSAPIVNGDTVLELKFET